uniref:Uncharacterized protein n=1 Tax=Siphoviridae sp. ctLmu1 TaxID=2826253 RepID=A0A8S5NG74_9CAUD|nr:MAG TPA: hypothetical protein [Siphoviridae sp. ctLmu1]DAG20929.1 MAG TPA: hypothetical protein [Caudoviricetes sp.]
MVGYDMIILEVFVLVCMCYTPICLVLWITSFLLTRIILVFLLLRCKC